MHCQRLRAEPLTPSPSQARARNLKRPGGAAAASLRLPPGPFFRVRQGPARVRVTTSEAGTRPVQPLSESESLGRAASARPGPLSPPRRPASVSPRLAGGSLAGSPLMLLMEDSDPPARASVTVTVPGDAVTVPRRSRLGGDHRILSLAEP